MKIRQALTLSLLLLSPIVSSGPDLSKELEHKLNQITPYLTQDKDKDTDLAWQKTVVVADFIAKHPEYDDGEYAESMSDLVVNLLAKPWKYASPYLVGNKATQVMQNFVLTHVNELSVAKDLLQDRNNVEKNCDLKQYPYCVKLIHKINSSILSN